jgi:nitrite reductase/ring-hydroxylating ferredoxin subunit
MKPINRRDFVLAGAAVAACACAFGGELFCSAAAAADRQSEDIDAGPVAEFSEGRIFDKLAKQKKILIVRDDNRLVAVSAICTHKACSIKPRGDELRCPCHGSRFSSLGEVKKGPARNALMHLGIRVNSDGHVRVDPSQQFTQDQWNDPKSFVALT